jgi:hypothetical protein
MAAMLKNKICPRGYTKKTLLPAYPAYISDYMRALLARLDHKDPELLAEPRPLHVQSCQSLW